MRNVLGAVQVACGGFENGEPAGTAAAGDLNSASTD